MISNIGIYEDTYIYKGNEYNRNNYSELLDNISRKRRIIFLSQILLIKKYGFNSSNTGIGDFIKKKINEDFSDKDNFLFSYEYNKKENIAYLYSIRNNNLISLTNDASELTIEPIQFHIKNKIIRKIKNSKDSNILFKINNIFHVLSLEKGYIINSVIANNEEEVYKNISLINNNKLLIIDKSVNIESLIDQVREFKIKNIDLVEGIYEKIYRK
ncbi:hypothetical protein [Clostridium sp.]|uniref:hypothetical protein n=1 Tax=Clostridium sp. TaxID=1506 RepID=UPI001D7158FD|nr:hypothetical protein [Clostridium sp.]MBS5938941.1 hypothetical protein [Clostridium sp.]